MLRWRLKRCPRCNGDLLLEAGLDGADWLCFQCGYIVEAAPQADAPALVPVPIHSSPVTVRERRAS